MEMTTPIQRTITFAEYIDIQSQLNEFTVPGWKSVMSVDQYRTAMFDECAELMGSTNWKWWKHQDQYNSWNLKMEVIDIFHFALSIFTLNNTYHHARDYIFGEDVTETSFGNMVNPDGSLNHTKFINKTVTLLEHYRPSDMSALFTSVGMTAEEISAMYVAKSQLNMFRQQNGYKDGTYAKIVDGLEDNERLKLFVDMYLKNSTMSIQHLLDAVIAYLYEHKEKDNST